MDLNPGPLVSEATALPTAPQQLPYNRTIYVEKIFQKSGHTDCIKTDFHFRGVLAEARLRVLHPPRPDRLHRDSRRTLSGHVQSHGEARPLFCRWKNQWLEVIIATLDHHGKYRSCDWFAPPSVWPDVKIKRNPSYSKNCPKVALPVWLKKQCKIFGLLLLQNLLPRNSIKSPNLVTLVVAQLAERSLRYQRSAVRIQSLEIFIQIIFVDFWKDLNEEK